MPGRWPGIRGLARCSAPRVCPYVLWLVGGVPIPRSLVIVVDAVAELQSIIAGELIDRAGWSRLQLLLRIVHHVGALRFVVFQPRPGDGMVLLGHAEESAETYDGKQDVVGLLVEHDVLDLANFLS